MIDTTENMMYPFAELDCDDIHALMIQTMMSHQVESFDRHCSEGRLKLATYV